MSVLACFGLKPNCQLKVSFLTDLPMLMSLAALALSYQSFLRITMSASTCCFIIFQSCQFSVLSRLPPLQQEAQRSFYCIQSMRHKEAHSLVTELGLLQQVGIVGHILLNILKLLASLFSYLKTATVWLLFMKESQPCNTDLCLPNSVLVCFQ